MLSLPLGSFGRQCRPVLSWVPEPLTVASFWATWKSIVQGRSAAVSVARAVVERLPVVPVAVLRQDAVLRGVVAERVEQRVGHVGLEAERAGSVGQLEQLHHPLPAMHAAPADFALGGEPLAVVGGDVARPGGRSRRSSSGCLRGRLSQSPGPAAESMRTTPYGRTPSSRSRFGDPAALVDLLEELLALGLVAHRRPAAGRRPDRGDDRADRRARATAPCRRAA